MADIVVATIRPQGRARWAELGRGYLDFYETELPPEIYEQIWQGLIASEGPIRGLGHVSAAIVRGLAGFSPARPGQRYAPVPTFSRKRHSLLRYRSERSSIRNVRAYSLNWDHSLGGVRLVLRRRT